MARSAVARVLIAAILVSLLHAETFAQYLKVGDLDVSARENDPVFRLVKSFDFNERPLGNFEEVPMHWQRLGGPGMPAYSRGAFDDRVGHDSPPSFRLSIETDNVAYEYDYIDLNVVPESDYFVYCHVLVENIVHSRAFLAAYLVNRFGERIAGSDRVSNLAQSARSGSGSGAEPWQRLELGIPGEFADAHALRLQLWILQSSVWRAVDDSAIDPITRRDVRATAWFDDLKVLRLPRARLRFSNPAGLVLPGKREAFLLEVNNTTTQTLVAETTIRDMQGNVVLSTKADIPRRSSSMTAVKGARAEASHAAPRPTADAESDRIPSERELCRCDVPDLPHGVYRARVRVLAGQETLLERSLRFAVLKELPRASGAANDIGIDLGAYRDGSQSGLTQLCGELSAGAVKIGVPLVEEDAAGDATRALSGVSNLIRDLAKRRIETVGVLLPALSRDQSHERLSNVLERDSWRAELSPTLAHFGGALPVWQLGDESVETAGHSISDAMISATSELARRFITAPELIRPQHALNPPDASSAATSILIARDIPTRDIPRQMEPFLIEGVSNRHFRLQLPDAPSESDDAETRARRRIEIARRITLAKACGPPRLFVDAPFRVAGRSGVGQWEPDVDFIVVRTMLRYLVGKRLVATLSPAKQVNGFVFRGAESACMVLWSWRSDPEPVRVEMYLGRDVRVIDLDGVVSQPRSENGRTELMVGDAPIIVDTMDSPQAILQASLQLTPKNVQPHDPDPRPILSFRNPYDTVMSGELRITPPPGWEIQPPTLPFELAPGETLKHPLVFTMPPQQIATAHELKIAVQVRAPETARLEFTDTLTVGLHQIEVTTTPRWQGDTLIVEQSLRNLSDKPVRFTGFCAARGRPRAEAVFANVKPGESASQYYHYSDARDLAGTNLHVGVQEIHGDRRLNQLVEVPGP